MMAGLLQLSRPSRRVREAVRAWWVVYLQRRRRERAQSASPPAVPSAPENLSATDMGSFVRLAWEDVASDELGFRVYRDGSVVATLPANSHGYDDTTAEYGNRIYYVVAYNASGESADSNHVSIPFGA